jgi:hypothetical protein
MVWPYWHCEMWAIIGCDKPKQVRIVVRKWVYDKWNVGVVGRINNQAPTPGPAQSRNVFT